MIPYLLAKKLKDAGFPQKEQGIFSPSSNEFLYFPTLSELIDACGEKFNFLHNGGQMGWTATAILNKNQPQGEGSTPEEAVSMLWLAINKA